MSEPLLKSGFITLIGRSNVGKSTLMNTLVGTKVAAVTEKPQTTRSIIHGVINDKEGQAIIVDTPGVLKQKKDTLSSKMIKRVKEALQEIDVVVYVVDPTKQLGDEERFVLSIVRKIKVPKLLVINKSDVRMDEKRYLEDYLDLAEEFDEVFELSALKDKHIEPLKRKIFELLPVGELMYPDGQITNLSEEEWISEIIREKIFNALYQEIPYSTHVEVESIEDKEDIILINANIYTYDKHYKKMIIGHGGQMVKKIGTAARKELELALNKKIFLQLEVETDRRWEDRI